MSENDKPPGSGTGADIQIGTQVVKEILTEETPKSGIDMRPKAVEDKAVEKLENKKHPSNHGGSTHQKIGKIISVDK